MQPAPEPFDPLAASRRIGRINWIGVWTLYVKEVRRFAVVATQTVLAPIITTLLFLAVFALALGGAVREIGGVPFIEFLAPGLIMMAIAQNAFANTSSSILISKVQGNIVDMLMPPLSPGEFTFAYAMAGTTRGLVVGISVGLAMLPFVDLSISHAWAVLAFAGLASLMLSLIGLLGGLWANKFDHMAAITNFVVTPLAFLSGTFYSVERLPGIWYTISHVNPFFFMIDGFRYGFIDRADSSVGLGIAVLAILDVALWAAALVLVRRGYKLKA
ncbi:MAG: ABC transporter permease [Alphaproteobacteria bacterium]|nr:ABC transporter permease [Alphaproteobacteria bacterium]